MSAPDVDARLLRIHGHVQGVGYRNALHAQARHLGVSGWVRNRSDGSVEALVSGSTKAVEIFVTNATKGPQGAKVSAVDLHVSEPPKDKGFVRRPSL